MSGRAESLILLWAERMSGRLRDLFGKSRILQGLSRLAPRLEASFREAAHDRRSQGRNGGAGRQARLIAACREANEKSLLLGFLRGCGQSLAETAVGSFGAFGILYGGLCAAMCFAELPDVTGQPFLLTSLLFMLLSLPLLHVELSLSAALKKSIFFGWLLFDFCGLPEEDSRENRAGRLHYGAAIFLALIGALFSPFFAPQRLLLCVGAGVVLWLLFALPELCAVAILFFFPFLSLSGHAGLTLAFFALLCELAWLWRALLGRRHLYFGLIDLAVLLFALLFLFGGVFGLGGIEGAKEGLLRCVMILFWFPTVGLFAEGQRRARAVCSIKLLGGISAVWGIVQYYFTELELLWVDPARFGDLGGRVSGPYGNPNILSVALLLTLPMMLAGVIDASRARRSRFFDAVLLFCGAWCLILTWTRGAWLGALTALLFFLLSYSRKSAGGVLLLCLPALLCLPFLPSTVIRRFSSIGSFSDSSIRYRLYTWRGVGRMLRENVFGIGVGSEAFARVYPRYAVSGTEQVVHTHQLFLQVMGELGLPGAALFLIFLLLLLLYTAQGLATLHDRPRAELLGTSAGVLGALVMGLFDHIWYHSGMLLLFFTLCAALTWSARREEGRNTDFLQGRQEV